MKATINGIVVEGTPEEIMRYQEMQHEQATRKLYKGISGVQLNDCGEYVPIFTTTGKDE